MEKSRKESQFTSNPSIKKTITFDQFGVCSPVQQFKFVDVVAITVATTPFLVREQGITSLKLHNLPVIEGITSVTCTSEKNEAQRDGATLSWLPVRLYECPLIYPSNLKCY